MALIYRVALHPATTHIAAAAVGAVTLRVSQYARALWNFEEAPASVEQKNKEEKAA
jgi:hypothetical protein